MNNTLSIVIPCLNEQEAVSGVLNVVAQVRAELLKNEGFNDVEVIVIDDASTDNSAEEIQKYKFVQLHRNIQTLGYGASLKKGFSLAQGDGICFFDMDGTYPAEHIPAMWHQLTSNNLDVVLGRRSFIAEGMSVTRGAGNWFYSQLTKVFFKSKIGDACTGFRLFKRECLPVVMEIDENTLGYSLEMTIRLAAMGYKTQDYDIPYYPRKGESKLTVWRDGWLFLSLILAAAFKKHFRARVSTIKNEVSL